MEEVSPQSTIVLLTLAIYHDKCDCFYALTDEENSMLVQLKDCTCHGHNQTFECTIFGAGLTIWRGSTFSGCQRKEIWLHHSLYINSQATGQCSGGEIMAESVGASENCYTSQLSLAVREEMVSETIECIHNDLAEIPNITIIGRRVLNLTMDGKQFSPIGFAFSANQILLIFISIVPYPPPTNVRFEAWVIERNQVMFAWDKVPDTLCSSICGVCPNTTADTNITCVYTQSHMKVDNNTCMFAVQTKICGYLRGERSEYVNVHLAIDDDSKYYVHQYKDY